MFNAAAMQKEIELKYILYTFCVDLVAFSITVLMRYIYQPIYKKNLYVFKTIFIIGLISYIASILTYFAGFYPITMLFDHRTNEFVLPKALSSIMWNFPFFFVWSLLYFGIKYWIQLSLEKEKAEKANLLAQSAQLQMLRYQLNPHFLFNSLNSVWALIDEDKKASKEMISELSEFLRYSLVSKNYANVPLKQELDAIRLYFSIEKKRFEEKLDVTFDIEPEAEEYPVLSFLVHPLVENAVKYGMKTSPMPLKIVISGKVAKGNLHIEVKNTGKWVEPHIDNHSTGTGIKNIQLRLENAFPGRNAFTIGPSGEWVVATILLFSEKTAKLAL
jgi:LytS/YehU family sensor histidine kinase